LTRLTAPPAAAACLLLCCGRTQAGGRDNAGKGVKIGILSVGVAHEHPAIFDGVNPPKNCTGTVRPRDGSRDANAPCCECNNKLVHCRWYEPQLQDHTHAAVMRKHTPLG
jgi:hypothetical protein